MGKENVQGLILVPYRYRLSRHLFFNVPAGADAKGFLKAITPGVSHGSTDLTQKPPSVWNVGFTYEGLLRLGCDPALATTLDASFKEGPDPRTMGDVPGSPSAGSTWWDAQWPTKSIHVTVQIYAREPEDLSAATQSVLDHAAAAGLAELLPRAQPDAAGSRRLDGAALPRAEGDTAPGAKVHFGYRDGFSQPEVAWDQPENGKLDRGHFLLGYSSLEAPSAPVSGPAADFFQDSSYMILRWMKQDVAGFEQFLTAAAPALAPERSPAQGREYVAAKLMGRWRDGTPLTLSPERPDPSLAGEPFGYMQNDAQGARCPFSAHVRVVNPRDQPLTFFEPFGVPRVIRRGMPYGPAWPDGETTDDGIDRGVIGIFLCTSIVRQFYILMSWVAENNFSPVIPANRRHDQDSLIGNRQAAGASGLLHLPGATVPAPKLPDFVRTRGTAFFIVPSLRALNLLSQ